MNLHIKKNLIRPHMAIFYLQKNQNNRSVGSLISQNRNVAIKKKHMEYK